MVLVNKNTRKQEKITNTLALSQVTYHLEIFLPSSFFRALQARESLSDPLMCVCVRVYIYKVLNTFLLSVNFLYIFCTLYIFFTLYTYFLYTCFYILYYKFRTIHTIS